MPRFSTATRRTFQPARTRFVYFMTIDGRQFASEGATTSDVGAWLLHFGAYTGANMDGGGSTTMAWWDPDAAGADKSVLLNHPRGGGFFDSERHNGNNLGVYFVAASALFSVVVDDVLGTSFTSESNATYRLQSTPDLVSSNYSDTGGIAIGNGGVMTLFDPTGPSTSKNYQVLQN